MIPIGDCVAQLKDIYEDITFPIPKKKALKPENTEGVL